MNLVVLADDAFTLLLAWEFMSLSSWALVMAHHRERDNVRAGYVYLVMASFGTLLALLLAFGLLAGPDGAHLPSTVIRAVGAGEQAEGQQQRQEACRSSPSPGRRSRRACCPHAVVRHHQRPRRQRHELPGEEKAEGVVREHHQVHAGEEGGKNGSTRIGAGSCAP